MRRTKGYHIKLTNSGKLHVQVKVKEGSSYRTFETEQEANEWGKLEVYRIRCRNPMFIREFTLDQNVVPGPSMS